MGMFNSVYVPCPNCGTEHELQSKSGSCSLRSSSHHDAEIADLGCVANDPVTCEKCGAGFVLRVKFMSWVEKHFGNDSTDEDY